MSKKQLMQNMSITKSVWRPEDSGQLVKTVLCSCCHLVRFFEWRQIILPPFGVATPPALKSPKISKR